MRLRSLSFLLPLLLLISSCQFRKAVVLPYQEGPKAPIRDHYVILVNMDGAREAEVRQWATDGHLPNIHRLFFEEGAVFENAINHYPTVSLPNHQAFTSGLLPGHHGIPALDWFSRPLERHIDYLKPNTFTYTHVMYFNFLQLLEGRVITDAPQLIYDTLRGHPTLAFLEPSNFGVTQYMPKTPPVLAALDFHYRESYETIDFVVIRKFMKVIKKTPLKNFPRFSFVNLYGLDNTAHYAGPDSDRMKDLLRHYDRFLGEIEKTLKVRDLWNKTTLVLVSDHGQHYIEKVVSLPNLLREIGLDVNEGEPQLGQVVWGDHGTGTSNLYFKWQEDWKQRPSYAQLRDYPLGTGERVDLIEKLLEQKDIEMVFLPESPLVTHLFTDGGHGRILRKWQGEQFLFRYDPDPGVDPLGYLQIKEVAQWVQKGQYLNQEEWLRVTASARMPDALVAISTLFDDYRTGDIIIQTPLRTQFKEVKVAAHGSLDRTDRHINIMVHGPDIQAGTYPHARAVDTYPLLLALFGLESTAPMDGVLRSDILKPQLREQRKTPWGPKANQGYGMKPKQFKNYLQARLARGHLSEAEQEKTKQLIYDLDQYFSHWEMALGKKAPPQEEYLATRHSKKYPLKTPNGHCPENHRNHLDSHKCSNGLPTRSGPHP